jgi:pilus assembly protein CpaF
MRVGYDHQLPMIDLTPAAHVPASKFGEIRGGEAFDLLQLLNTGHSGTLSTIHANSARQGLTRFTSCVLQSGIEIPYKSIKANIAESVNVIIQLERRPGRRVVSEVLEIESYSPDKDRFDYIPVYERLQESEPTKLNGAVA